MRSHNDLRHHQRVPGLVTREPGAEPPLELTPAGLFVEDNNIESFVLHCKILNSSHIMSHSKDPADSEPSPHVNHENLKHPQLT